VLIRVSRFFVLFQPHFHALAEDQKRLQYLPDESPDKSMFSRMVRDLYPYLISRKISAAEQLLEKRPMTRHVGQPIADGLNLLKKAFEQTARVTRYEDVEPIYRQIRAYLQQLSKLVDDQSGQLTMEAQREGLENLRWAVFFTSLFLLFGGMSIWASSKSLSPLPRLIESIKQNASGDFRHTFKVNPNVKGEFALLAREYNRMLSALAERDHKIEVQQKELLHAEKLSTVGKLSSEVVHEIRNPLNAINLNIDWLRNELHDETHEVQKTLHEISREVARLHDITERHLMRSRIDPEIRLMVDLNELIREIMGFLKEEHRQKNITIIFCLARSNTAIQADKSRIRQAFLNLFRNSCEAMPHGGEIHVSTHVQTNTVSVEFRDTGSGMNVQVMQSVFRPFFSTKPGGTGLGLMLTKTAVEEANGSLELKSAVGVGTVCLLRFPAAPFVLEKDDICHGIELPS
jgi:signal transduction histidine kinase